MGSSRSMRTWRKFHRYTFGYSKWISLVSVVLLLVISITGILLVHQDELKPIQKSRVPLSVLPSHYENRLEITRDRQGTKEIFAEEKSVPLRWVILDLHTGDFFGKYGFLLYDVLAVVMLVMGSTGIYMYFKIRKNSLF
ncbi:MAG: PepSY domain-containing protein [FCB group bacterium]|nr:PepSY domain-containing protein [FCB group bacterium]MBL7027086.1 PepSY domain-containing protein [Candidatus Neomarinimicrobiota bacterium]MBL7122400.1 PepSY domain-containing protein [Candidatus Neomarinimicrobiota bacterium]